MTRQSRVQSVWIRSTLSRSASLLALLLLVCAAARAGANAPARTEEIATTEAVRADDASRAEQPSRTAPTGVTEPAAIEQQTLSPRMAPVLPTAASTSAPEPVLRPDFEATSRSDRAGRIMIPVKVNGQGPFRFMLDTGANRTMLTPRLVEKLGIQLDPDTIRLNGVTGSAMVPAVTVNEVAVGDITIAGQQLPVADALTADIDGILGVDGLEGERVLVNFMDHKVEIRNSRQSRPIIGAERQAVRVKFGRLMVVDGRVNGVPVKVVVDTGSERTLGNAALRNALHLSVPRNPAQHMTEVIGETLERQEGEHRPILDIRVGDLQISNLSVVFGNFYVFHLWELEHEPAIVLGMDMLALLDTFVVDYQRGEIQLRGRDTLDSFHMRW